jgi:hypothetical protein
MWEGRNVVFGSGALEVESYLDNERDYLVFCGNIQMKINKGSKQSRTSLLENFQKRLFNLRDKRSFLASDKTFAEKVCMQWKSAKAFYCVLLFAVLLSFFCWFVY